MIGYIGTGFTILAYSMRHMLSLRVAAVLSSVALLVYAVLTGSGPIIIMELILLPINSYRLIELLRPSGNLATLPRRHAMVTSRVQKITASIGRLATAAVKTGMSKTGVLQCFTTLHSTPAIRRLSRPSLPKCSSPPRFVRRRRHFLRGAWFICLGDDYGSLIEILPCGTVLDQKAPLGIGFDPNMRLRSGSHVLLSTPNSTDIIQGIAARMGWHSELVDARLFKVLKVWVKIWSGVEFLTPEIAPLYRATFGWGGMAKLNVKLRDLESEMAAALAAKAANQPSRRARRTGRCR